MKKLNLFSCIMDRSAFKCPWTEEVPGLLDTNFSAVDRLCSFENFDGEVELIFNNRRTAVHLADFADSHHQSRQRRRSQQTEVTLTCVMVSHCHSFLWPFSASSQLVVCAHFEPWFVNFTARCCSCIAPPKKWKCVDSNDKLRVDSFRLMTNRLFFP